MRSHDLILISDYKEVTKKYISCMFGDTHIYTFFVTNCDQDLELYPKKSQRIIVHSPQALNFMANGVHDFIAA